MRKFIQSILFAAFAFASLTAEQCGDTHYISDSGFDLWCGEELCNWEVASGTVQKAPTWHKDDYAVELLGPDTRISQTSEADGTDCLRFSVLAEIAENARVTLQVDLNSDDTIDYEQELGRAEWEVLVHLVSVPDTWRGARFTLHKEGPGRVRLAQIEASSSDSCFKEVPWEEMCRSELGTS